MVIHSSNRVSPSPGLLPTPSRQPNDANFDSFIGRSYYPLPYPLVTILEGSELSNLISWDISVNSKQLKLKLEWSVSSKVSNSSSFSDLLPKNVIQAINIYEIFQPSWSISAAKSKLSTKIEWQISPSNLVKSSPKLLNPNVTSSSTKSSDYRTPMPKILKKPIDSGFGSSNLNSGIHSDSLNWRRSVNLPPNPIFDSPHQISHHHDIYVAPKCKEIKASSKLSKNSSSNLPKSVKSLSPDSAQEVKSVNVKPSSQPQGKTPKLKETKNLDNIQLSSCESTNIEKVSLPSFVQDTKPAIKKPDNQISQDKTPSPQYSIQTNAVDQSSSRQNPVSPIISSKPVDMPTNQVQNKTSNTNDSSSVVYIDGIPIPKGFPKKFLVTPNPLPIVGDGFLDPKTNASFMNIQGTCRLCNSTVKSYLIDFHLINCSGLDRQPLDSFVKDVMKDCSLKKKQVVEASNLCSKFELNEATVPNKYFKKVDKYRVFAMRLENLSKSLTAEAFKKLNISPKLESFNILKYR